MKPFCLLSVALFLVAAEAGDSSGMRVVCYYATWAYGYSSLGKFLPTDIDPTLCTHIMYSFITMGAEGEIELFDPGFDIDQNGIENFVALKEKNPDVNLMAAIGGWTAGSVNFSAVVNDESLRNKFVENAVTFLDTYGFNGLDLDWEYPNQGDNSSASDYVNFVVLVENLKTAFAEKGYLLSAAVQSTQAGIDLSYNVTALSGLLDFINLMSYDFHGTWDGVTGVNAPLYPQVSDDPDTVLTTSKAVEVWISNGADPAKLNLGLGNYGHAYTLADANNNGTGAPITTDAYTGPYAGDTSTWTYLEICSDQKNNTADWTIINNNNSYVYAIKNDLWIGYDDENTMEVKGAFAKNNGLGGIMFWALHGDDFQGYCGEKYGLIKAATKGYKNA